MVGSHTPNINGNRGSALDFLNRQKENGGVTKFSRHIDRKIILDPEFAQALRNQTENVADTLNTSKDELLELMKADDKVRKKLVKSAETMQKRIGVVASFFDKITHQIGNIPNKTLRNIIGVTALFTRKLFQVILYIPKKILSIPKELAMLIPPVRNYYEQQQIKSDEKLINSLFDNCEKYITKNQQESQSVANLIDVQIIVKNLLEKENPTKKDIKEAKDKIKDIYQADQHYLKNKSFKDTIEWKTLEITILAKPKAMTEFLPSVSAELNKTFTNPDGNTQSSSFNKSSFAFAIEQDIFTGGSTIAKLAAADAEINAAYQEYNKSLNEIILNAITSYQNVLTIRELVRVQKENVDMAQKSVEKATITVKTGAETKTSLFMAKATLAAMKSNLEDYLVQQNQAESSYLYLIGEEAPKKMDMIDVKKYPKIDSFDKLKIMVNAQNPDLLSIKNKLKASKQAINIQASGLLPRVSLFANRSINKYSDNTPSNINKADNGNTYGIKMSIPLLYKGGVQYLNISEAKKKSKQTEYTLKDTINNINFKTSDVWKTYISSENIYKSYLSSEDNYYKTYLSTQSEFDVGAKTLMENQEMIKSLNKLANDNNVKAVLVNINSTGGTGAGGESLYRELRRIAKNKPVVASIGEIGASAGYMVALGTDRIFAYDISLVGSIGVIIMNFEINELAKKHGINLELIKSSPLKGVPNYFEKLDNQQKEYVQNLANESNQYFIKLVKNRRNLSEEDLKAVSNGKIFIGTKAMKLKLIDQVGDMNDAINWLKQKDDLKN
ncbi:hypothetical protein TRIADDRAFT_62805 [Trichoplax adhaerens]|uniref:Peptidase S49 domain-containing protein n=1 Tax=Trichoplax adhaerens TaxID=10228 RepID=B3SEX9_TRIAD|nr:hypothetical protein TRIADDRAFT_62805 [Trichoplax adhaerens]EDV18716.1 hypothetical protein TRIADDRAFT_62805 [Trichoplax adhaerens]|eukprot:XP_002118798.1 hypothetical protein TRIADDRAFT_62805 [Trichoplax adhaerens]